MKLIKNIHREIYIEIEIDDLKEDIREQVEKLCDKHGVSYWATVNLVPDSSY